MEYPDYKCDSSDCDAIVNLENGDYWSTELHGGKTYCYPCGESDTQNASTIWYLQAGAEPQRVHFGNLIAIDECGEVPEWFTDLLPEDWSGRAWKSADAWRGHFQTINTFTGILGITDGWTTGWTDDYTARKEVFNDWIERLIVGIEKTPVNLYVMFEPTSNVFSTGVDVFCKTNDEQAVRQYLESVFGNGEILERALS